MEATYKTEFPDFGDMDVAIPEGFKDVSWGNDACPCFANEELAVFLWVDYAAADKREFQGTPRFVLQAGEPDENHGLQHAVGGDDTILVTDDWEEIMGKLAEMKNRNESAAPSR